MSNKGFTLLELTISIGILALIGALALVSFINSRNIRDLATSGQNVLSVLRDAQARALAGEDNSPWGVRLENTRFILFRGTDFTSSTSTQIHDLPPNLELVNISLAGGGQEAVFNKLDGRTNQAGTFDIRIRGRTEIFSISIDASGKVSQTGTAPAITGTRLIDTRHRNFNLGWSIKDSLALVLTFSDPDFTFPIVMEPPPPRTTFDWSGTVLVGGENQTLRIHAISITNTNTVLSVDRDCRRNTKRVRISIDARDIATYEADCKTMTVGTFGGSVSEP